MENEIPPVNRVDEIRDELKGLEGKRLRVKANMGRSRIVERTGTLVHAHPSLFIVEVEDAQQTEKQNAEGEKVRAQAMYENMAQQFFLPAVQQMAKIEDLRGKYF